MHTIKKHNKIYLKFILCMLLLLFTGCGEETEKEYRIIYNKGESATITIVEGTELSYSDFQVYDITSMDKWGDMQAKLIPLKEGDLEIQPSKGWNVVGEKQTLKVTYQNDKAVATFDLEILGHDYHITYKTLMPAYLAPP